MGYRGNKTLDAHVASASNDSKPLQLRGLICKAWENESCLSAEESGYEKCLKIGTVVSEVLP